MSENEIEKGHSVIGKALGIILPLITLTSIVFGIVSTVTAEFNKVDRIEKDYSEVGDQLSKMNDKIADINKQIVEMKITTARIEERTQVIENSRSRVR